MMSLGSPTHSTQLRNFGVAWVLFAASIALHVADETVHNFLSIYNPNVLAIRARVPWLPLPTFEFREWLFGLFAVVLALFTLSPFAFRGARWLRAMSLPLGIVIGILNGAAHITTSLVLHRWMPGVFSSPILICAGALLFWSAKAIAKTNRPASI